MAERPERVLQPAAAAISRRLHEIQPAGSRPPLFVVEPSLLLLRHLMPLLGPEQPILGLQMAPIRDTPAAFERLESIAEFHASTMQAARPDGPYVLAGHSFAGLVAFATAQHLLARGDGVRLVLLLDTICPTLRYLEPQMPIGLHARRVAMLGASQGLRHARWYVRKRLLQTGSRLRGRGERPLPPRSASARAPKRIDTHLISCRYAPSKLPAPAVLLRTRASLEEVADASLGWERFVDRLEVSEVSGDHSSMQQEPCVRELAEAIARHLVPATGSASARGAGAGSQRA